MPNDPLVDFAKSALSVVRVIPDTRCDGSLAGLALLLADGSLLRLRPRLRTSGDVVARAEMSTEVVEATPQTRAMAGVPPATFDDWGIRGLPGSGRASKVNALSAAVSQGVADVRFGLDAEAAYAKRVKAIIEQEVEDGRSLGWPGLIALEYLRAAEHAVGVNQRDEDAKGSRPRSYPSAENEASAQPPPDGLEIAPIERDGATKR